MNRAAQALGRRAKGVPKTLTPEQREQRRRQLAEARKKRHPKKGKGRTPNVRLSDSRQ